MVFRIVTVVSCGTITITPAQIFLKIGKDYRFLFTRKQYKVCLH